VETTLHIRSAHAVELNQSGNIIPLQRLSYADAAALEHRGFEVLRQDLSPTWGEFGTLARSADRYYLLALA
jgi:hypothetical protein